MSVLFKKVYILCALYCLISMTVKGQSSEPVAAPCDIRQGASITINFPANPILPSDSLIYILTNADNEILSLDDDTQYDNLLVGGYSVYELVFAKSGTVTGLSVGQSLGDVTYTGVFNYSNPETIVVCPRYNICDFYENDFIALNADGEEGSIDMTEFILTDSVGTILQINSTATFGFLPVATYFAYALSYETAGYSVSNLTVGSPLNNVSITGCYDWSAPYIFNVCPAPNEICGDGIDNNFNQLTDEMDWECRQQQVFSVIQEVTCCTACPTGNLVVRTPNTFGNNLIISDPSNLALNKRVFASSREFAYAGSSPIYATDGIFDDSQVLHTEIEESPWLEIDLIGYFDVSAITVSAKADCCAADVNDYTIVLSEQPFMTADLATTLAMPGITTYTHSQIGNAPFVVATSDRTRFVRIFLSGPSQLNIKEIEIAGVESTNSHPYQYSWSDGSIGDTAEPTCLSSGTYTVTITDIATGVNTVQSITVN